MSELQVSRFALVLLVVACTNELNGPGGDGPGGDDPNRPGLAQPSIRRMTSREYKNTLRDLFPGIELPALTLVSDNGPSGFDNDATALTPSQALVDQLQRETQSVAERIAEDLTAVLPCAAMANAACGRSWVDDFGARAFRRPLQPAERDAFVAIFDQFLESTDFETAFVLTTQAILQAPPFLYRIETGDTLSNPYDVASRLSYFLWGSMPDAALLQAAAQNQLTTPTQIAAQVDRMLQDPRAVEGYQAFAAQWLQFARIASANPEGALPWDEGVRSALYEEAARFMSDIIFSRNGTLRDFLTSTKGFISPDTAAYYGRTANAWTEVELADRAGYLLRASFLVATGHQSQPSPILRGSVVTQQLLCVDYSDIPPPTSQDLPPADPNLPPTNRNKLDALVNASACSACHQVINPVGYAFERYDQFGQVRNQDNGYEIDSSGEFEGHQFADANGLRDYLTGAGAKQVSDCVTRKALVFASGSADVDATLLADVQGAFTSEKSFKELMKIIATSSRFLGTSP